MKKRSKTIPFLPRGGSLLALSCLLAAAVANAGTITNSWTGAIDDNWSAGGNWDPAAPSATSTVFFGATDPAPDRFTTNNIVDGSRTVDSIFYWTTNVWQTTEIPSGTTLTVSGKTTVPLYSGFTADWAFFAGKNYQDSPTAANAAILGGGSLVITNPAAFMSVRCFGGYATLDLAGLSTFDASVKQLTVGCEGFTQAALQNRPAGILYLAKTNIIRGYSTTSTAAGSGWPLAIGENRANAGSRSYVYMGITNAFLNDAGIVVGGARSQGTLIFNSANEVAGAAYFRSLDGTGRQSEWRIGDNNTSGTGTGADGVADFTSGTIDAKVTTLYVGRGLPASNTGAGVGTLAFMNGLIDVNTVWIGYMRTAGGPATGTITTMGGAAVTNLIVNGNLTLGLDIGDRDATGTLNINSSVVVKGNIVDGGGPVNTVNMTDGTLYVGGTFGANLGGNNQPIGVVNLYSGALTLNLGSAGNPITPVCNVQNLYAGNVTLNLEGSGLTPGVVPLVKYYASGGFGGFTLGSLPAHVVGSLSNSTDTLYLVITGVDTPKWKGNVSGDWDINATANWILGFSGTPTTYMQASIPGDPALFDDTAVNTNVNLTTTLSPASVTVNNTAKAYNFTGGGSLSGPASLSKLGDGTLILANTGSNDFTGNVVVGGGTLRLSGSENRLPTNAPVTMADAAGALLDLNGLNQQVRGLAGGGANGGNIALGGATLSLSGNSGIYGGSIGGAGGLLKIGAGTQTLSGNNTYSGGTVVSNGTLRVANASGDGIGAGPLLIAGGTLEIGDGTAAGNIPQTVITNNGTVRLNRSDDFVFDKSIVGAGGLTKLSPNIVVLTMSNAYSGITAINDGALRVDNSNELGTGMITIGNTAPARLELTNNIVVTNAMQLSAKGGALNGPAHIESLSGTNRITGPITAVSTTEFSFQSDDGLFIVDSLFRNSTGNILISVRGAGTGVWNTGIIDGTAGGATTSVTKRDAGTWTISKSSTNTYGGVTTLTANGGTLIVDGALLNSAGVSVGSAATLGGSGLIVNGVTNNANSFLVPGDPMGTLTISNWLSLSPSATSIFEVGNNTSDQVVGLKGVIFGGTLQVVVAGTLYGVENFKLFDSQSYNGNFGAIDLPDITPLSWDTTDLDTQGILRVKGGIDVSTFGVAGGLMQLSGTGPAGQAYRVLATANIALPIDQWTMVGSGTFDASTGAFSFSDPNTGSFPRRFYRVATP